MKRSVDPLQHRYRRRIAMAAAALTMYTSGCATEGTSGGAAFYGDTYWYDDPWYWSGCCVDIDRPDIGPPRPEHPIALPPEGRPSQPIATPPAGPSNPIASTPRPTPMPRAAARGGRR